MQEISKNAIKFVRALQQKKIRQTEQLFVVEGEKSVLELLQNGGFAIQKIYCSTSFYETRLSKATFKNYQDSIAVGNATQISQMSFFENNTTVLAVVHIPTSEIWQPNRQKPQLVLTLDAIRDPGNLGTILRIADWYGLEGIICSNDTVDFYNPKTIAASMGSFLRVKAFYTSLEDYFKAQKGKMLVVATDMEGENLHSYAWQPTTLPILLLIGNEAQGISPTLLAFAEQRLSIPRFGEAESLNAGIAAALFCDSWRRSMHFS
ncbi:MAG: RNA methyltransferase [Cytophagales bacterium]|nr:MAG: RNA methyltransferase [Cytophagales bacterium]